MEMENDFELKFLVYQTLNLKNSRYYIGLHPTEIGWDNYLGSGIDINDPYTYQFSKTPLQQAVKEFGIRSFRRIVLNEFNDYNEALDYWKTLINKKSMANALLYNQCTLENCNYDIVYRYEADCGLLLDSFNWNECSQEQQEAALCGNVLYGYYYTLYPEQTFDRARKFQIQNRPVYKYEWETGMLLNEYQTQVEAERANKYSNITRAIKFKRPCKNGFLWSIEKFDTFSKPKYRKKLEK